MSHPGPGINPGPEVPTQAQGPGHLPDAVAALWKYLDQQQSAKLGKFGESMADFARTVDAAFQAQHRTLREVMANLPKARYDLGVTPFTTLLGLIGLNNGKQAAATSNVWRRTVRLVLQALTFATRYAGWLVGKERAERIRAVLAAEAKARQLVRALHHTIEAEATAGYNPGQQGHSSLVDDLLRYLADHNPLVSGLVRDLAGKLLDLAAIEDPVERLLLGHLVQFIIDRVGVDQLAAEWLRDLLTPWIGDPSPKGLRAVLAATTARLSAVEGQWAQFYANGGSEVEQAGRDWSQITSPVFDAALLAFFGAAVLDPAAWGRDLSATAGRLVGDTLTAAVDLIRKA